MAIGSKQNSKIAVWVVTPNGLRLARRLQQRWLSADVFCSRRLATHNRAAGAKVFDGLREALAEHFHHFRAHIFIMATGIVVRSIAPHLRHKTVDPAVVVVDDRGRFAISLTCGHLGGANVLAHQTAACLDAVPVITTATDINRKAAIDVLATDRGLKIENPEGIKAVNMALLTDEPVRLHDPDGWLQHLLPNAVSYHADPSLAASASGDASRPGVWIDDTICDFGPHILVLRPPSLVAGIGCNRNTPQEEIRGLLDQILEQFGLACASLCSIASIDLKADEEGLCALAATIDLPLHFFTSQELARVENIQTPSAAVAKHVGVPSVCEAAAILASRNGRLIVPKHSTKNVTVAIARKASISSVSDPAIRSICPDAPGRY
jgi:cobalt-precorrin 5A hydrolase